MTDKAITAPEIADHPERHRYELSIAGELAAQIAWRMRGPGTIEFLHTEVEPAREGQGLGSKIAKFALDDAKRRGLKVVPTCEYIAKWIERHPEYAGLVAG